MLPNEVCDLWDVIRVLLDLFDLVQVDSDLAHGPERDDDLISAAVCEQ